jgi:hypothetical protein
MLYTFEGILSIQAQEKGCKMEQKFFDVKSKAPYFEPSLKLFIRKKILNLQLHL